MFLLVTLWLSQVMIDFERIIAIINCNQQRMRIITQGKGKKAETWLSNILIDGKVISWLLMTDFSTVSTSANPVGEKGKEWLCFIENYCPQLTVFMRNGWTCLEKTCRPSFRTISVWQDCSWGRVCLEVLWVALLVCPASAQWAFIPFKLLHPLQSLSSPNPAKAPWGGPFLWYYRAWAERNGAYDRNPVSVSHSHSLSDLKSFLLMKAQLIHQLSLAFWYSQMKRVPVSPASGWSDVTPRVLTASFPAW